MNLSTITLLLSVSHAIITVVAVIVGLQMKSGMHAKQLEALGADIAGVVTQVSQLRVDVGRLEARVDMLQKHMEQKQ